MYFGKIPIKLANFIQNKTGLNVVGYNLTLRANEIKKIINNSHGNEIREDLRGQRVITKEDLLLLPQIINNPDEVILSDKLFEGKPVIEFRKLINGKMKVITYVSSKHHDLTVQTMYSGKKNESLATTPSGNKSLSHTSKTLSGTAFTNKVPQNESQVKSKSAVDDTIDSEYMTAVNKGDMETAQRLVDEAAEKAFINSKIRDEEGKLLKVYHGTPKDFTVFRNSGSGMYFTADPDYARGYTQLNGKVLKTFLNIKKPFDILNDSIARKIFIDEFIKGGYAQGIHPSSTLTEINKYIQNGVDWVEGDNLIEFLEENEYDYDGLIINEGSDSVATATGNVQKWRGYSYVTFNSEQIKSADPVTYDDDGNVIPLSERFKDDNKDIRYSVDDTIIDNYINIDLSTLDDEKIKVYNNRGWSYSLFNKEEIKLLNERFGELNSKYKTDNVLGDGSRVVEINNNRRYI